MPGSNPPPTTASSGSTLDYDDVLAGYEEIVTELTQRRAVDFARQRRDERLIQTLRDRVAQQDRVIQELQAASEASSSS